MSTKQQMLQAKYFIQQKQYVEAQQILQTIDHPIAEKWLRKVNHLIGQQFQFDGDDDFYDSEPTPTYQTYDTNISESKNIERTDAVTSESEALNAITLGVVAIIAATIGIALTSALVIWAYYAPIAWAVVAGLTGYVTMTLGVKFTKVRDGNVAIVIGALTGLLIWVGFYVVMYLYEQQLFFTEFGYAGAFGDFLLDTTGQSGIVGYFMYRSTLAVEFTIYRIPILVEGTSMLIAMLLELPAIMIAIAAFTRTRTQEPFCTASNNWVKFKKLGHVPFAAVDEFLRAIAHGDYRTAGQIIQKRTGGRSFLTISTGACSKQGYLRIATSKMNTDAEGTHTVSVEAIRALAK